MQRDLCPGTTAGLNRSVRPLAGTLFGVLALIQLLCLEGHINTPDGQVMFNVNRAILERGSVAIAPLPGYNFGWQAVQTDNGQLLYSKFGLGNSLAALPFMALGQVLLPLARNSEKGLFADYQRRLGALNAARAPAVPYTRKLWYDPSAGNYREALLAYFATWANPLIVAGIGTLLFLLGMQLGFGPGPALLLALASNFATPLWHYAGEYFAEPLSALAPLVFLWAVRESRRAAPPRTELALLGGLGLGLGLLARTANALLLPWAALYALWLARGLDWRAALRWLAGLGFGGLVPLLAIAAYNYARFHSVLETGYGGEAGKFTNPFWGGLYGLTLSPGRGLLWHHPLILLGLGGAWLAWRRWRAETVFIFGTAATYLAAYSKWYNWEGGWCWGPRFLVAVLPLLLLPALPAAQFCWRRGGGARAGLLALLAAAVLVAFGGVLLNYNPFICWLRDLFAQDPASFAARWGFTDYWDIMRWRWEYSPVVRAWDFPVRQLPVLIAAFRYPGLVLAVNLVLLGLLIPLLFRLRRLAAAALRAAPE